MCVHFARFCFCTLHSANLLQKRFASILTVSYAANLHHSLSARFFDLGPVLLFCSDSLLSQRQF